MAKSILQSEKQCLICLTEKNLHCHHVYEGTGRRKISDRYGLTVYLCARHHNMSNEGIHFNKKLDNYVKRWAQKTAMNHYGWSIEEFIKIFGKNYL